MEEGEQRGIVPADFRVQRAHTQPIEVFAKLLQQRGSNALASEIGVNAERIEHRDRFRLPELAVVDAGQEEPGEAILQLRGQRHLHACFGEILFELDPEVMFAALSTVLRVHGNDLLEVFRTKVADDNPVFLLANPRHLKLPLQSSDQLPAIDPQHLPRHMPAQG